MKNVLILVGVVPKNKDSLNWTAFQDLVQSKLNQEVKVEITALSRLIYDLSNNGSMILAADLQNRDIAGYDLVIFRTVGKNGLEKAITASHYLNFKNTAFTDSYLGSMHGAGKLACAMDRIAAGLPTPRTVHASPRLLSSYLGSKPLGKQFVFKSDLGKKGRDNYLLSSPAEIDAIIKSTPDIDFVAQEFIPNDGDYRAVVFGGKIRLLIKRVGGGESHLNNVSQGAKAQLAELDELSLEVQAEIIKAAKVEGLEVAGVDLMFDKYNGKHYFLEVNRAPQISTGAFTDEKVAAYADMINEMLGEKGE